MSRKKGNRCDPGVSRARLDAHYWQSAGYANSMFYNIRDHILQMALNRYRWINLPDTCDEWYLESKLLFEGVATIAKHKETGAICSLGAITSGMPDLYGYPSKWQAIGANGRYFDCSPNDAVLVYDNRTRYALISKIEMWARELTDLYRTKQINRFHQKIPLVLAVEQEQEQQAINMFKQISGCEPGIIATKAVNLIEPKKIAVDVPYIGDKLESDISATWNAVYRDLGISTSTVKAEHVLEDEMYAQNEPTALQKLDGLSLRRAAAKKANKIFFGGMDMIQVIWNSDITTRNYDFTHDVTTRAEATDGDAYVG